MMPTTETRWWNAEKAETAERVLSVIRQVYERQGGRQQSLLRSARLFGDLPALGLSPRSYSLPTVSGASRLSLNLVKTLSRTVRSDLVSGPAPRPWFLTTGGDYDEQQKAEKLTKFAAGVIYQTKFDRTARRAALHSAVFGTGIVKIFSRDDKPCVQLVFPWELHVEEADGHYGEPRSLYQTKWIDRSVLRARFPKFKQAITDAKSTDLDPAGGMHFSQFDPLADQVLVVEAWHLSSGPRADDGRHVICIDGQLLFDEDWAEADGFPFVFFHWDDPLIGFWPVGIAEEIAGLQYEVNLLIERIRQALCFSVPRVFIEKGSKLATGQLNNDPMAVHHYVGAPPTFMTAATVSPELVQQIDRLWGKSFQITGVSELSASAMKPAGLDSGKALRVYADMQSKRFTDWSKGFQDFYLEVSRQLVRLMRRIAEDNPDVDVVSRDPKSGKPGERIAWRDIDLDEESYVLQAYQVSSLPNDPAGRMAVVDEMANTGWIDPTTAKRLTRDPDIEAELALEDAPRDLLEQIMGRMLSDGQYVAPEPFFDLQLALKIGALHYQKAVLGGVPEERLDLLRRFLVATQALMKPPAPPPGAAPMPGPEAGPMPPGMAAPPMPPMPPGMAA